MNRRRLRQAVREAIGKCNCTARQRLIMRARLGACDSEDTLDIVEDELQQRMAAEPGVYAVGAIDWGKIVDLLIKIIEEWLATKN